MIMRTAEYYDHQRDLRKNWQPGPELTPQQHADIILAFWQSRRRLPPSQRLGDDHANQ